MAAVVSSGQRIARHTTFNDDAMVRVMELLRESYTLCRYDFLGSARHDACRLAFERGIECILKCQIKVDGHLTAWCAQHDELDYAPRPGRTFELTSLSGSESVEIVELLMSLDPPTPQVARAIESAVAWFEAAKIEGIREVIEPDPRPPSGRNKVIVKDPAAPPVWARFYEFGTNRPIFADRDGVARHDLAEIGYGAATATAGWATVPGGFWNANTQSGKRNGPARSDRSCDPRGARIAALLAASVRTGRDRVAYGWAGVELAFWRGDRFGFRPAAEAGDRTNHRSCGRIRNPSCSRWRRNASACRRIRRGAPFSF